MKNKISKKRKNFYKAVSCSRKKKVFTCEIQLLFIKKHNNNGGKFTTITTPAADLATRTPACIKSRFFFFLHPLFLKGCGAAAPD